MYDEEKETKRARMKNAKSRLNFVDYSRWQEFRKRCSGDKRGASSQRENDFDLDIMCLVANASNEIAE